jgi:hypothetical protein
MTSTKTQESTTKNTVTKTELLEIVNSQAITIRAIMELLNLTEEKVREKGIEIIKKLGMSAGPYDDDEDGFYDDEDDFDDEDDDDFDDEDDFEDDDSDEDFEDDEYSFKQQEALKAKIGVSGISHHPAGAVFFGG